MDSNQVLRDYDQYLAQQQTQRLQLIQQQATTPPETAPPPYSASSFSDSSDDEEEEEDPPLKLTLNAAHSIRGNNNLIPTSTSTSPLSDATKFSSLLLHALTQINNNTPARGNLKIDLTINCGLTVVGDRNVIGHVGLRPKATTVAAPAAVAGAKRKAEEGEEPVAKKIERE